MCWTIWPVVGQRKRTDFIRGKLSKASSAEALLGVFLRQLPQPLIQFVDATAELGSFPLVCTLGVFVRRELRNKLALGRGLFECFDVLLGWVIAVPRDSRRERNRSLGHPKMPQGGAVTVSILRFFCDGHELIVG